MSAKTARYVFFDLDGTLVDSRAAVEACYRKVFAEQLHTPFSPENIRGEVFAMRPREVFGAFAPEKAEALYDAYQAAYPLCAHHVKTFDDAAALIERLRAAGRKPGLVTNKGLERTLIDLDVAGIAPERFETIVTAEDTAERKPHPAPILLGMSRVGAAPADSVYVGDGPQDILAARAAGLDCIALTYGFYAEDALTGLQPAALARTGRELAAHLGAAPS